MAMTAKFAGAALALSALSLGGCAKCIDNDTLRAVGFLAPRPQVHVHHKHAAEAHAALAVSAPTQTGSITPAPAADTELSKCNQALYLKAQGSPEDIHALEEKCRALIVNQPN